MRQLARQPGSWEATKQEETLLYGQRVALNKCLQSRNKKNIFYPFLHLTQTLTHQAETSMNFQLIVIDSRGTFCL